MEQTKDIAIKVNGVSYDINVPVRYSLADCLREQLDLTGTHLGCEHGFCGACTVIVDENSVRSCLMLAVQADGSEITTIEGLAENGELNSLQQAFRNNHGLQCGFCTPGFLLTATELLKEESDPSDEKIKEALSGNICRCTGYQGIMNAIKEVGKQCSNCDEEEICKKLSL